MHFYLHCFDNDCTIATIVIDALGTNYVVSKNLTAMFRIAKGVTRVGTCELGSGF
jgi:hypothetical protein